ncbi:hypothetical protein FHT70_000409 [Rhizobium sp. BK049]|nr:hypothetical protein [Rhizobium sp. BK049]
MTASPKKAKAHRMNRFDVKRLNVAPYCIKEEYPMTRFSRAEGRRTAPDATTGRA